MIVTVYDRRFPYIPDPADNILRPVVPIRITYGGLSTDRFALVDSGADISTFPKTIARILGIDLSRLTPDRSTGTAGKVKTWYCQCDITVEGITQRCDVAIVNKKVLPYLLGRDPFFKLLQIGFRESRGEFYLLLSP